MKTLLLFLILCFIYDTQEDCVNKRCDWEPWFHWNDCDSNCGGGTRTRSRHLCCKLPIIIEECKRDCGVTSAGFRERQPCNRFCYNGGTFSVSSNRCNCGPAYHGSCCQNRVTCGRPANIQNGGFHGSNFDYLAYIHYYCNNKYQLTGGDVTHQCKKAYLYSSTAYWYGTVPRCAYVHYCESNPCQNNATCENGLDMYTCRCQPGYTGTHCEFDIVAPSYTNCSSNITHYSVEPQRYIEWPTPVFWDPHGHKVEVSSNYEHNGAVMPWGEYTVQYIANKPSNGLRSECTFNVAVYPLPCRNLFPPEHGALACNKWNSRFTEVCALFCEDDHDVPVTMDINDLFVCGSSGNWMPFNTNVSCSETRLDRKNDVHFYPDDCSANNETRTIIQKAYIDLLKASDFAELCSSTEWNEHCTYDNVNIIC